MKIVIGIILTVLLIGIFAAYLIFVLNAHQMIFCGDVTNETGATATVTRVYTSDVHANETLSEIVTAINTTEGEALPVTELTEILAEYQNIIYAPVFTVNVQQIDNSTYEVIGSVYNGIDEKGNVVSNDYVYRNLRLNAVVQNGQIIAVNNIYPVDEKADEGVLVERAKTIDPIITDNGVNSVFALEQCDTFRLIFQATEDILPTMTFVYTYDVSAENPLDFTGLEDGALGLTMNVEFDEEGNFDPSYNIVKTITVEKKKN